MLQFNYLNQYRQISIQPIFKADISFTLNNFAALFSAHFVLWFLIFTAIFYEQALSNKLIASRFSASMGWHPINLFMRSSNFRLRLKCCF